MACIVSKVLADGILLLLYFVQTLFPDREVIPEPGFILTMLLNIIYEDDKLSKLEYLTVFYKGHGLVRFEQEIYVFDPKLSQKLIHKLEKGAHEFLDNSPLKDTFLSSSNRIPEVRRAIAALFRRSSLEENGKRIVKDAENMCEKIKVEIKNDNTVNITDWSLRFAIDIVGHMLLEVDLSALEGEQEALINCILTILHRCFALGEISPESREFIEANDSFERLTTDISLNSLKNAKYTDTTRLIDKLHEACGFEQARDNMKLFLMAGSETTASTIPVLVYLLAIHPDIQEELRQESDDNIEALHNDPSIGLPKLEAVLKEVLRLYPIAPFVSRVTRERVTINNITFESNTDIKVFMWGIHRSSEQWSRSKDFVPFRFLNDSSGMSSKMYIPFGAGSRICIGQHLARMELKIAAAVMLNIFKFSCTRETPTLKFVTDWAHAVVHPEKDLIFKVELRS